VVAIPSRVGADGDADGVPVVLGEAMAAGVPVVASRQGGLAEHVTDGVTGLLTEPGSVDELAATLSRLTSDDALAKHLAEGAARYVEAVLDVDRIGDEYAEILASSVSR
jgi:glycosyltransferase involved in cell wall biosynthesis